MKKLLLVAMAIGLCLKGYSQANAIGLTQKDIVDYLATLNTHETLIEKSTNNGYLILQYNNDDLTPRAYFFKNDTCVRFAVGGFLSMLPTFISGIKPLFIKISDNEWVDKKYVYKLTLTTDDKYFNALYQKM